jgi:hypothetical protein
MDSNRVQSATFNINLYVRGPHRGIEFTPRGLKFHPAPKRQLKGLKLNYQLQDDTAVNFALTATDEWGNPTTLPAGTPPVVTVSDPTILKAEIQPDGSLEVTPLGKLGASQVVVTAGTITGSLDVTVVGGTATSFAFVPGTTTPVTVPPATGP